MVEKYDKNKAEGHSYVIITCCTKDKEWVMDFLLDAEDYKLVGDTVDCWYYIGDTIQDRNETEELINTNLQSLTNVGIKCELSYS